MLLKKERSSVNLKEFDDLLSTDNLIVSRQDPLQNIIHHAIKGAFLTLGCLGEGRELGKGQKKIIVILVDYILYRSCIRNVNKDLGEGIEVVPKSETVY